MELHRCPQQQTVIVRTMLSLPVLSIESICSVDPRWFCQTDSAVNALAFLFWAMATSVDKRISDNTTVVFRTHFMGGDFLCLVDATLGSNLKILARFRHKIWWSAVGRIVLWFRAIGKHTQPVRLNEENSLHTEASQTAMGNRWEANGKPLAGDC